MECLLELSSKELILACFACTVLTFVESRKYKSLSNMECSKSFEFGNECRKAGLSNFCCLLFTSFKEILLLRLSLKSSPSIASLPFLSVKGGGKNYVSPRIEVHFMRDEKVIKNIFFINKTT